MTIERYQFSVLKDINQGETIIPINDFSVPNGALLILLKKPYPCICDLRKKGTGDLVKIEVTGYNPSNLKNGTPLQIIISPLLFDIEKGDFIIVEGDGGF